MSTSEPASAAITKSEPASAPITAHEARRRYPGVRSFDEQDWKCFFGRGPATEELLLRVLSVHLLLQFAPSGVGKTSLLNAGLFPELRQRSFFPFTIRLNEQKESLTQAVRRSLKDAAKMSGVKEPVIPENTDNLWELLAGAQLWSQDLLLLTPVLVFDQFEEIFTLRDEAFRKRFAEEIGTLSLSRMQGLRNDSPGAPSSDSPATDVKIIISLREEYLGKLEDLSASIPDLFHERLRLAPLSARDAEAAIVEPAKLEGDTWYSPCFDFDRECLEGLIDFIDGSSEKVKVIESLTLQLVCQRAEDIARQRNEPSGDRTKLRFDDFGGLAGLKSLVQNYFETELSKLDGLGTPKRAREMFEQGLLDPNGKRLMLEQDEIARDYGLDAAALHELVERRLLRREPRNESVFYEISHDRLAEAITKNRKRKLPRWVKPTIAAGVAVILITSLLAISANEAANRANEARSRAEAVLGVLLGEELTSVLREAGLTDALERVLNRAEIDGSSESFALALSLRHQGDILVDRGTIKEARDKFEQSLEVLNALQIRDGASHALLTEQARTQRRIGSLLANSGEVSNAEQSYNQSIETWNQLFKDNDNPDPQERLDASETWTSLGSLQHRMGNAETAEASFTQALRYALEVLTVTYDRAQADPEIFFAQGRAMQIYADSAQYLVSVWGDAQKDAEGAHALARESFRLRPLSAVARILLGSTSARLGSQAFYRDTPNSDLGSQLLRESREQFDELNQWDPYNRRLQRESAAVQLVIADGTAACAADPACKNTLSPGALEDAELAALDSIGDFRMLAGLDPENRSLNQDIGWGLQTQATVLAALGDYGKALALIDEAFVQVRFSIVDMNDIQHRLELIDLFLDKAELLDQRDQLQQALAALDDALAELDSLPDNLPIVRLSRYNTTVAKIELLKKLNRTGEANKINEENERLLEVMGRPWDERSRRAHEMNDEGVALHEGAIKLTGVAAIAEFRQALDKYTKAIEYYPFDALYWENLRNAYQWIAAIDKELQSAAEEAAEQIDAAAQETPAAVQDSYDSDRESTLRNALTAAWMARVLSNSAESWRSLYTARLDLDQYLYNENRISEVLPLIAQEVLDAEQYARQQPQSPEALFLLADANVGLGMLRFESKYDGWEEAFRKGLAYGLQLMRKEPANAERRLWIGDWRKVLGDYLSKADRKDAAALEHTLAGEACRQALTLQVTDEQRERAEACLKALAQ